MVRDVRAHAKTIQVWHREHQAGIDAQNHAAEIILRADRRLGELCKETDFSKGAAAKRGDSPSPRLADLDITKKQSSRWQQLAAVPEDVFEQHVISVRARGEKLTTTGAIGAVSFSSDHDGDEWYTPTEYIEAARKALGGIDLDPASNPVAQRTVKATRYFTREDDGLSQEWGGHVFLNPPFSNPLGTDFVVKLCEEYDAGRVTEAVLLQNAGTGTIGFHRVGQSCSAMCFSRKRIAFLRADGTSHDGNRYAQVFCYFGPDVELFAEAFGALGLILTPERRAA